MKASESNGLLLALCGFALRSAGDAVVKAMARMWPGAAIAITFTSPISAPGHFAASDRAPGQRRHSP